eukprot:COSAG01_NODE_380_length_17862_cov_20.427212_6_plen_234_part_00
MSRSITSRSGQAAPSFEVLHGPDVFAACAPAGAPPRMHVQVRAPSAWRSRRELASSSSSPSSSSSSSSSSSQQQQQQEEEEEELPAEAVGSGRELVRASCEPAEAWLLDTLQRLRAIPIRRQAVDAGVEAAAAAAAAAAASPHSEPGAAGASSLTQRVVIPASTFGAQMADATAAGVVWDGPTRGRLDALAHWSLGPVLERCSLQVRSAAVFSRAQPSFWLGNHLPCVCRSKS